MNKTEARYAEVLEVQRIAGEIVAWEFETIKLKLADRTFYEPDFMVVTAEGFLRFVEVKGRPGAGRGGWEDDARVKIKVAAEKYPWFEFVGKSWLSKKQGGPGWKTEFFWKPDP